MFSKYTNLAGKVRYKLYVIVVFIAQWPLKCTTYRTYKFVPVSLVVLVIIYKKRVTEFNIHE